MEMNFDNFVDKKSNLISTDICNYNGKMSYNEKIDSSTSGIKVKFSLKNRGNDLSGLCETIKKHLKNSYQSIKEANTTENIPDIKIDHPYKQEYLEIIGSKKSLVQAFSHLRSAMKSAGGSLFNDENYSEYIKLEIMDYNVNLDDLLNNGGCNPPKQELLDDNLFNNNNNNESEKTFLLKCNNCSKIYHKKITDLEVIIKNQKEELNQKEKEELIQKEKKELNQKEKNNPLETFNQYVLDINVIFNLYEEEYDFKFNNIFKYVNLDEIGHFKNFISLKQLKQKLIKKYLLEKSINLSAKEIENEIDAGCILKVIEENSGDSIISNLLEEKLKSEYDLNISSINDLLNIVEKKEIDGKDFYQILHKNQINQEDYDKAIKSKNIYDSIINLINENKDKDIKTNYKNNLKEIKNHDNKIIGKYENQELIKNILEDYFNGLEGYKSFMKNHEELITDESFKSLNQDYKVYYLISAGADKNENPFIDVYIPKIKNLFNHDKLLEEIKGRHTNYPGIDSQKIYGDNNNDPYIKISYAVNPKKAKKIFEVVGGLDSIISAHYYDLILKLPDNLKLKFQGKMDINYIYDPRNF